MGLKRMWKGGWRGGYDFYNSTYRIAVYMSNCVEGRKLILTIICDIVIQIDKMKNCRLLKVG